MHLLTYLVFRFFVAFMSILPFSIIYFISDGVAFLLRYVVRYRTNVISENLKLSFPDKSDAERKKILKESFRNLSDIILESMKGMSMNYKQILQRYQFKNIEILDPYYKNGQAVLGVAGHLANWEWATRCIGMTLDHQVLGITKKINNPYIHKYIHKKRTEECVLTADTKDTSRAFINNIKAPTLFVLIADQSPLKVNHAVWLDFLNRKTPFLHGPETYAKKYKLPIMFMPIVRTSRGVYEVPLEILITDPSNTKKGEITKIYAKRLEQFILAHPEQWLWSHNRWKRAHLYPGD